MTAALAGFAVMVAAGLGVGSVAGATSAPVAGAVSSQITGVSCVSASFCMAVGSSALKAADGVDISTRSLVERWNGKNWSVSSLGSMGDTLVGVSCTTPTFCIAVGDVMERWNGAKWLMLGSPKNNGTLNAVSCTSTLGCVAAGSYGPRLGQSTLVERWNGKNWTVLASPSPSLGGGPALLAVSCPNAPNCFAVGYEDTYIYEPVTLAEQWKNGKTWSAVWNFRSNALRELTGVSCTSVTNCTAVGWSNAIDGFDEFGPLTTLVQHWNGTTWSTGTSSGPSTTNSELSAVSCTSTTNCVAVGDYNGSRSQSTLVEHWNGTTWSTITSPNPTNATGSQLASVSCTRTTNCVAVGTYSAGNTSQLTLAERWNGTTWSIVTTPTPPAPSPAS